MTRDECRDFRIWFSNTYVNLRGEVVYVRDIYEEEEVEYGEVVLTVRAFRKYEAEVFRTRIETLHDVSPIPLRPRVVDSGTAHGQVYVSRSPRRQYRKSISPRDMVVTPNYVSLSFYTVAENYIHKPPQYYTPREAKERVLSGAALWSAISNKVMIGAVPGNHRYVCSWKGRVVGSFALNKLGEPDVKKLTLTKPNEFLLDSISEVLGVQCRVNSR